MKIKKRDKLSSNLAKFKGDGSNVVFADDVNNIFPLDSIENLKDSLAGYENLSLEEYSNKEVLILGDKFISIAKGFDDLELIDDIKKSINVVVENMKEKGNNIRRYNMYKTFETEAEYNAFVDKIKAEVTLEAKSENASTMEELKGEIEAKANEIDTLIKNKEEIEKTVADKDAKINELQNNVDYNKRVISVAKKLSEKELGDFEEDALLWVKACEGQNDEDFEKYVDAQISLIEKARSVNKEDDPDPDPDGSVAGNSHQVPNSDDNDDDDQDPKPEDIVIAALKQDFNRK